MFQIHKRLRSTILGAVVLASLAAATSAQAYVGDWTISGEFERTTTPSFSGGFNPNDVDTVTASFDNRAKQVSLHLGFFEAPSRGAIYISLGTGRVDGTCAADTIDIAIIAQDRIVSHEQTETVYYWVPARSETRWTSSLYGPGYQWTYIGWDYYRVQHRWVRYTPGHWESTTETHTVTGPDPLAHDRVAQLELAGIDGSLTNRVTIDNAASQMDWVFGSPLLNNITANCIEIHVPGRRAPFVISPPAVPVTVPPPTAPVDPVVVVTTEDEITLDEITTTAKRRGSKIQLRMTGDAEQIQIRIRKSSKTLDFKTSVTIKNQAETVRYVLVRFSDGTDWSSWDRIAVK